MLAGSRADRPRLRTREGREALSIIGWNTAPGDRAGDVRQTAAGITKPPVLRRATLRLMCVACLALVVYGTLGPLGYGQGPWLAPVESWRWLPALHPCDFNDILTNFVVYLPVGIAFRLLVRRRGWAGWPDMTVGFVLAVALSHATEVLQQFMPARSSNLTDVHVNAAAAFIGCLIAPLVQNAIRRLHAATFHLWHSSPWTVLAWAAMAATAVLMTAPWDFTWSSAELQLRRPIDVSDIRRFGIFAVVGFCVTAALVQRIGDRSLALRTALSRVFLFGLTLELAQIFLASHACGLLDIVLATFGGGMGCAGALAFVESGLAAGAAGCRAKPQHAQVGKRILQWYRGHAGAWRIPAFIALLATVVYAVVVAIGHGDPSATHAGGFDIRWMPFQPHFLKPFRVVITDAAENCAVYAFLTVLCMFLNSSHGRAAALLLLIGLVGSIESYQMLVEGGTADTTPLLLAVTTWFVTIRVSYALHPKGTSRPGGAGPAIVTSRVTSEYITAQNAR